MINFLAAGAHCSDLSAVQASDWHSPLEGPGRQVANVGCHPWPLNGSEQLIALTRELTLVLLSAWSSVEAVLSLPSYAIILK